MTWHKYRSAKMFLATGQFAIDTVNRTIQVTKRILAVVLTTGSVLVRSRYRCWIVRKQKSITC